MLFTDKSSISTSLSTQNLSLPWGLVRLSFISEARDSESVSLLVERDSVAFFVLDTFFLGASLNLASAEGDAKLVLSGIMLVSVCALVLDLRGSAKN